RWRVIRQCLMESLLLSLCGGALGLALAFGIVDFIQVLLPDRNSNMKFLLQAEAIAVDWRVILFAIGTAVVTGLVFGVIPAVRASKPNLNEDLKESARGSSVGTRARAVRHALVVAEGALGVVL